MKVCEYTRTICFLSRGHSQVGDIVFQVNLKEGEISPTPRDQQPFTLMAENAVQAACGAESKVKIFADQEGTMIGWLNEDDSVQYV